MWARVWNLGSMPNWVSPVSSRLVKVDSGKGESLKWGKWGQDMPNYKIGGRPCCGLVVPVVGESLSG